MSLTSRLDDSRARLTNAEDSVMLVLDEDGAGERDGGETRVH
jgi:hypothetical protein